MTVQYLAEMTIHVCGHVSSRTSSQSAVGWVTYIQTNQLLGLQDSFSLCVSSLFLHLESNSSTRSTINYNFAETYGDGIGVPCFVIGAPRSSKHNMI